MVDVALGVVVFTRTEKLRRLLESVDRKSIETVYIADNGELTPRKEDLYAENFSFETIVLDLAYDIGVSYSRNRIVDEFDEDHLLIVDSDIEIPNNTDILSDQLAARPDIGGIAGSIIEPRKGRIWQSAKDIYEENDVLFRDSRHETKEVEYVSDSPFVEFDMIPNVTVFRKECLQDYSWDPDCPIGREHADFFVGHWRETDWTFGICPEVNFRHYPGGDAEYTSYRHDTSTRTRAENYFLEKWGYDDFRMGEPYWYDTHRSNAPLFERAYRLYREEGLKPVLDRGIEKGSRAVRRNVLEMTGAETSSRSQ